ncbi:MAG: SPOR domain-containing protein [Candidatus Muiribacteriota bacterium]
MSNFDWEQIEKDAARKKLIMLGIIIFIIISALLYFVMNLKKSSQASIIPENIITVKDSAESITEQPNKHEVLNMDYTVKIGRFSDFSSAREFILASNIRDFNLYRENGEVFVNLGKIQSYEEAQKIRDEYIKTGFPAIVEIYEEKPVENFSLYNEEEKKEPEPEQTHNTETTVNITEEITSDKDISEGWTVQVAAFKDIKDATFLKNTLRFDGIESTIVKEEDYFKVWVGIFPTREQAQEHSKKIDSKKVTGFYIRRTKR